MPVGSCIRARFRDSRLVRISGVSAALAGLALGGCSQNPTAPTMTGSLTVTISAPAGVTPSVAVNGPAGFHQSLTATQTLSGLAAGSYAVSAAPVTATNPIVATVYTGTPAGSPAVVAAGATAMASVSYAPKSGTGALWTGNFVGGTVVAYTASQLVGNTNAAPTTVLGTGLKFQEAVAIDPSGNLWVTSDLFDTVFMYSAGQLAASGGPKPVIAINVNAEGGDGPDSVSGLTGLAFDGSGNLWVATSVGNAVVEYTAGQLSASGSPPPAITLFQDTANSLATPQALAFDRTGNLWVANLFTNTVVAFSPSQLAATGSPTPTVTLHDDGSGSISTPLAIAFDAGGNLWIANGGANTVVEFASSQLQNSGQPTPEVTLTGTSGGLTRPEGLAFDASGDLWVANDSMGTGSLKAFAPSQLVASGAPTANVAVSGSALTTPTGLAFDPAPANLPVR